MKTIKERAAEYAHKYRREVRDLSGERTDAALAGFIAGAESEREELLRWRDPEKELPEEYTPILVRYGHIETRKAVVWLMVTQRGRRVWNVDNTDMVILDKDIIGWRPIIEL